MKSDTAAHLNRIDGLGAGNTILRRSIRRGFWEWPGGESEPPDWFIGYVIMEPTVFREWFRKQKVQRTQPESLTQLERIMLDALTSANKVKTRRESREALYEVAGAIQTYMHSFSVT